MHVGLTGRNQLPAALVTRFASTFSKVTPVVSFAVVSCVKALGA
jgi:hypothetical protein